MTDKRELFEEQKRRDAERRKHNLTEEQLERKKREREEREQLLRLRRQRVECNHRCKDKSACSHVCCKEGVERVVAVADARVEPLEPLRGFEGQSAGYLTLTGPVLLGHLFPELSIMKIARLMYTCKYLYRYAKEHLTTIAVEKFGKEGDVFYLLCAVYDSKLGPGGSAATRCLSQIAVGHASLPLELIVTKFGSSRNVWNRFVSRNIQVQLEAFSRLSAYLHYRVKFDKQGFLDGLTCKADQDHILKHPWSQVGALIAWSNSMHQCFTGANAASFPKVGLNSWGYAVFAAAHQNLQAAFLRFRSDAYRAPHPTKVSFAVFEPKIREVVAETRAAILNRKFTGKNGAPDLVASCKAFFSSAMGQKRPVLIAEKDVNFDCAHFAKILGVTFESFHVSGNKVVFIANPGVSYNVEYYQQLPADQKLPEIMGAAEQFSVADLPGISELGNLDLGAFYARVEVMVKEHKSSIENRYKQCQKDE